MTRFFGRLIINRGMIRFYIAVLSIMSLHATRSFSDRVQSAALHEQKVTLYSLPDPKSGRRFDDTKSYFDFRSGVLKQGQNGRWDLGYGFANLSDEDWFILSTSRETRSVIKDLGELRWTDSFEVWRLDPLPELPKGEQRNIVVDTSADTGARWAKTTNIMARVVIGHIYLLHVKDEEFDFYVLFRVEEFKQRTFCTITWKSIPIPKLSVVELAQKERAQGTNGPAVLAEEEEQLLSPRPADAAKFASFLAQPDTGLFRLNPRGLYDDKLSIRGAGAYYSFTKRTHEYGHPSDVGLEQDHLVVGFAGLDWGFILRMSHTPIESINLQSPSVEFPAGFEPPQELGEIREWQMSGYMGYNWKGFEYKRSVPAVVDTTYILRSVHYPGTDVLVVFQPVRKDTDGSLIILWKILKRFPDAPQPQFFSLFPPTDSGKPTFNDTNSCFDFKSGALKQGANGRWDLGYGFTNLNNEDWFILPTSTETRSVIKDLGELKWRDSFEVRQLEPLPEISKREQRKTVVDNSGGAPDLSAKPNNIMAKVALGHIYLLHVKDDESDFYVLFRVETFKQQKFCTIDWKRIPTPAR